MSGHGLCPDRSSDVWVPMDTTFAEMLLIRDTIREGLKEAKFLVPSPIQRKALPRALCGVDAVFAAKSGTGKTAVFVITALQSILDLESNQPQVLILAPTREIAVQIVDVTKSIGKFVKGLKVEWFIGGTPLQDDITKLKDCRIIVGAPGRIKQLIELGHLRTKSIRLFVVDEADQMIQQSFYKDFKNASDRSVNKEVDMLSIGDHWKKPDALKIFIFNNLPESKQVLIFSATFTFDHIEFLRKYMTTFCLISADKEDDDALEDKLSFDSLVGMTPFLSLIKDQSFYSNAIQFSLKMTHLEEILKTTTFSQCLIFSNFKTRVKTIHNRLSEEEFVSALLSSEQSQPERLQAVEDLKHGRCRILVTTDLAARGIDVENVDTVINFEVPCDEQTYLHRMGRAGRYGSHGIVITIASEGKELENFKKILKAIKGSVLVLPSKPLVDAANVNKIQELALDEISGSNDQQQQQQQPPPEDDFDDTYVLHKEFLKKKYSCDCEDINLINFKSDIDRHVQKLAGNRELKFDLDAYFSVCKKVEYFHPELVEFVEKAVSSSQNKKPSSVLDWDLKENVPMNVCNGSQKTNKSNRSKKAESAGKTQNQNTSLTPTAVNRNYRYMYSEESFEEFLLDKLLMYIVSNDRVSDVKSSVRKNFQELRHTSSDFAAKLFPLIESTKILSNDHTDFSSEKLNLKHVKSYYYFSRAFKSNDQTLVAFVERKIRERKDTLFDEIQGSVLPTKVGFEKCASGVPLPASLIKKKPENAKNTVPKSSDPPKQKYLYLKQNFLKKLYCATKINKDFCVENFRPSIEKSFSTLWNSTIISTDVTKLLSHLDILRRPAKYLNNWTLEPLFVFSRHFDHLNPELVRHVADKIDKIEGEPSEDTSLKNSGCIPMEVLAPYYSKSDNLTTLKIDDRVKEKIIKRFSTKPDDLLNLKQRLGPNIFVNQSFERNYFTYYFKLCQTFKEIDVEFISYVNQKVDEMARVCQVTSDKQATESHAKTFAAPKESQTVAETSAQLSSVCRQPSNSDSSSVTDENFTTQPYQELLKYPPGKSIEKPRTVNFNSELNLVQNQAQEYVSFADSASHQNTVKLLYKDDEAILKAVLAAQESTQPYKELTKYVACKSGPVNSTPVNTNANTQLLSSVTDRAQHVAFSNCANYQEAVKLLSKDDEGILKAICSKAYDTKGSTHHQADTNFLANISQRNQASLTNLSLQESSGVFSGQPDLSLVDLSNQEVSKLYSVDKNQAKSVRKASKSQACSSKSVRQVNGEARKQHKINERENDSSNWVTASSSEDSDLDEDGGFATYGGHPSSMNLCDRCKNWYQSTESSEVPETRNRKKCSNSKVSGKKASKKLKKRSSHRPSTLYSPSPYEQLNQWYNMWHQQFVFSQQFVWWNEYIRNMSAQD